MLAGAFDAASMLSIGVAGNFSSSDNNGLLAVVCPASPSCGWGPSASGMVGGNTDVWAFDNNTSLGTGPITLGFGKAVLGAGAWLQGDTSGAYTAAIQAFNGKTSLGAAFAESSDSSGDPIFLGLLDTSAVVTSIQFSLTSCGGCSNTGDFAIDTLLMKDSVSSSPEPSSVLLLGSGLAWLCRGRRRERE